MLWVNWSPKVFRGNGSKTNPRRELHLQQRRRANGAYAGRPIESNVWLSLLRSLHGGDNRISIYIDHTLKCNDLSTTLLTDTLGDAWRMVDWWLIELSVIGVGQACASAQATRPAGGELLLVPWSKALFPKHSNWSTMDCFLLTFQEMPLRCHFGYVSLHSLLLLAAGPALTGGLGPWSQQK